MTTTDKVSWALVALFIFLMALGAHYALSSEETPIRDKDGKIVHIFVCHNAWYCDDNRGEIRPEKKSDGGYY